MSYIMQPQSSHLESTDFEEHRLSKPIFWCGRQIKHMIDPLTDEDLVHNVKEVVQRFFLGVFVLSVIIPCAALALVGLTFKKISSSGGEHDKGSRPIFLKGPPIQVLDELSEKLQERDTSKKSSSEQSSRKKIAGESTEKKYPYESDSRYRIEGDKVHVPPGNDGAFDAVVVGLQQLGRTDIKPQQLRQEVYEYICKHYQEDPFLFGNLVERAYFHHKNPDKPFYFYQGNENILSKFIDEKISISEFIENTKKSGFPVGLTEFYAISCLYGVEVVLDSPDLIAGADIPIKAKLPNHFIDRRIKIGFEHQNGKPHYFAKVHK